MSQLAISEIKPLDLSCKSMEQQWELFLGHANKPYLKDITAIRTHVQQELSQLLISKGFLHPPVHMFSTCVDPLNHETEAAKFDYYGQECSLMQSLIFHKMAILSLTEIDQVFWVSPNIRKEMSVSDPRRYASEFTQIDFESTQLTMESAMELIEELITKVINSAVDSYGGIIERVSGRKLKKITQPLKVFDAEDAAKKLSVELHQVEKTLATREEFPFFLTNLKREAYDRRDDKSGKYRNFDCIMPITGEALSGGEREHTHDRLLMRMKELDYPIEYFEPVLKLARTHGFKASTGAGFGVERLVRGILLLDDIADVYPFRREPGKPIVF